MKREYKKFKKYKHAWPGLGILLNVRTQELKKEIT